MAIQRTTMTAKPPIGYFMPKKTTDHNTFKASCSENIPNAGLTWFGMYLRWRQTRNRDTPNIMNSITQTGPNSQLGGLNDGLLSDAYHVGTAGAVKTDPMKPASWHMATLSIKRQISGKRNFCIICLASGSSSDNHDKLWQIGFPLENYIESSIFVNNGFLRILSILTGNQETIDRLPILIKLFLCHAE